MALFGKLFGRSSKNPYAAIIAKKIEAQPKPFTPVKDRTSSYLDRLRREREQHEQLRELQKQIKEDLAKTREEAETSLGLRKESDTSGIDPEDLSVPWEQVTSSNVDAIRWVGGSWGLQVRFLGKGWEYAYYGPRSLYEDMKAAPSKGKFVWWMRLTGVPYQRLTAGISPTRLAYNFGRTVGDTQGRDKQGRFQVKARTNRELLRNPKFALGKAAKSKKLGE